LLEGDACVVKNVANLQIDNLDVGKAPTLDNHSDRVRLSPTSYVTVCTGAAAHLLTFDIMLKGQFNETLIRFFDLHIWMGA
jgi:hypothetical protein